MLPITVNWERSPSAPAMVFGYDTKQSYSPEPTDNIYDSGNFDKINPNVFMGKRASNGKLNFNQYGKMFSQDSNSAWENNVSWAGNTGMSKSGNYQGHEVNFSQVSDSQFNGLIQAVGQTNYQVAKNSANLIQMGKDMTEMGKNDTYFGNSITRLDNIVNDLTSVWQKTVGLVSTNTNAIQTNSDNLVDVGDRLVEAKNERDRIEAKINGGIFPPLIPSLSLTTVALGGLAAYFLLRKK